MSRLGRLPDRTAAPRSRPVPEPVELLNPAGLHNPVSFGYSHVAVAPADRLVFVAGQYDSDQDGHTIHDAFADQVETAFGRLTTALAAVGCGLGDVVQLRTFIVDHSPDKLEILGASIGRRWGDRPPTQTLLGVAALALPDMQFEVDAVAIRS